MRKLTFFSLLVVCTLLSFSQEIIENPAKPISKNSGRVLQLREVMRIVDGGSKYYFKEPWGIDVAEEGSIFVQDGIRLYKFDSQGDFKGNIIKKGQGPGEITTELTGFIVLEREIIILSTPMSKLIRTDLEGNLIKELIFKEKRGHKLVGYDQGNYFLVDFQVKNLERREGNKDINQSIFVYDEAGKVTLTPYTFPTKWYFYIDKQYSYFSQSIMTKLQVSKRNQRNIFISHTPEYLIKQFDLKERKLIKIIRRPYSRVRFQPDKRRPFKYYNDVYRLLIFKDNLWVLTSTLDKEKGILVDVFDENGEYIDCFYLPLLHIKTGDCFYQLYFPVTIHGDFIYAIEHDADWNFSITKYEIVGE